jgi:RNA polymerase sigma-70 factor, ECF subfamily
LTAYACCRGVDFASAEDAVQQVFLRLLLRPISMPENPTAYLYRAVRNASLNLRRDLQKEVGIRGEDAWLLGPDGNAEEALSVQAALNELPEEQREAVFLKIWGGMTLLEIAGVLEIPMNTAASRYRYALEKLRQRLRPLAE